MLNIYIYYHLPPTRFGICYTIFRETIALIAQKLYSTKPHIFLASNAMVSLQMV
jgi:hypothetical protein